jgi:hypothetical protein
VIAIAVANMSGGKEISRSLLDPPGDANVLVLMRVRHVHKVGSATASRRLQ